MADETKFNLSSLPWTDQSSLVIPKPKKRRRKPKPRASRPQRDPATMTITLNYGHQVNGMNYGPGTITVAYALAQSLKESDTRAAATENAFWGTKACIIGPRTAQGTHRVTQVPPEMFETSVEVAVPADRASGKGMMDPGAGQGVQF